MKKLIKRRKGKISRVNDHARIYLQDSQLKETSFQPGQKFKYLVDKANNKITIVLAEESRNAVSSRNKVKPVIDIRNAKDLEILNGHDEIMISIFEDQIILEILEEVSEESVLSSEAEFGEVIQLSSNKKYRVKQVCSMEQSFLKAAVGQSFEQISIDDFLHQSHDNSSNAGSNIVDFRKAIEGLKIPLLITSLYSGAGGLDYGFIKEGFTVDFALEMEAGAVETYRKNIGDHIVHANILEYDLRKIAKNPIMIGGPFCKKYSAANRKTNISGKLDGSENLLDHPDNILIRKYVDAIKLNERCKVFVLENVPQILSVGVGKGSKTVYDDIVRELSDFDISSFVLNSADYGSGQKRSRAFIVGSKIGHVMEPIKTHEKAMYKTVRESFEGIESDSPNQQDFTQPKVKTLERMKCVRPGSNWRDIPDCLRTKRELDPNTSKHQASYRRLEWDKVAYTITNVRKMLTLHPEEHRALSVRESAALFDLPHDFEFRGSLSSKQQQVANMVPAALASALARSIKACVGAFNSKYERCTLQAV